MLVSVDWLRDFVPYQGEVQDLADKLTMLGLEVEDIRDPFAGIASILTGRVVECGPHPEADKLSLCRVDLGREVLDIVCGAPNVAKGQNVAVAPVGTSLPGGVLVKKAKLRGAASMGMICSERELGLSDDHSGIMVLDQEVRPGRALVDALGLERVVLDLSVTPNRADCLSVLGVARETALGFGLPLTPPASGLAESEGRARDLVRIEIAEPEHCPLYMARIIQGAGVRPGPAWMRYRLLAVGLRPINNLVDVTNYILMELGQPLHAFDRALLQGGVIRVARARQGMDLTTLDGQSRALTAEDLLIWDADKPVALAGVMGGANSEIGPDSSDVLLECAVFRPGTIRRTARRLALPSEASYRFERGVDQVGSRLALDRAAALMAEVSGGRVLSGLAESEPLPWTGRSHDFRIERCNSLLGLDLSPSFCRRSFELMGCGVDDSDSARWRVSTPPWRLDLEREVDLYEEAARVYGLDRIPVVLPRVSKSLDSRLARETEFGFERALKAWACGAGLREAVNYSFVGQSDLDLLGLPAEGRLAVANPLSEDQNVMRTALAPGLLANVRHNISQGNNRLRLFELARAFFEDRSSETGARELPRLGILLYGGRHGQDWPWPQADADYLDLKGLAEDLAERFKLGPAGFALAEGRPYLAPCVSMTVSGRELGLLGRVRPDLADAYHARKEVWLAELDAGLLRELCLAAGTSFKDLPKFPPVRRDMTAICRPGVRAADIERAVAEMRPPLLEAMGLVDVYEPDDGSGTRNLTFRLTYRHASRTLKDKEVDREQAKVLDGLAKTLPVRF
ncbi:MAG: phenylalanine--tRNA ligase subunit beta [Desulfovibrionaceae bacterium]|nr:phenylalanine--tRNA ligase subunit beta [Desulfovibrionaceae bacterium]